MQASAQRSLELHEKEFEGLKMSVLISDPQRKKERTDVTNNQKEIYVAGLARSVTDEDVRKLFAPVRCPCFNTKGNSTNKSAYSTDP